MMSELLIEKDRVQTQLAKECTSVHEYLTNAQLAAKNLAAGYGFNLQYVTLSTKFINLTAISTPKANLK